MNQLLTYHGSLFYLVIIVHAFWVIPGKPSLWSWIEEDAAFTHLLKGGLDWPFKRGGLENFYNFLRFFLKKKNSLSIVLWLQLSIFVCGCWRKGSPSTLEASLLQVWHRTLGYRADNMDLLFLIFMVSPGIEIKELHLPFGSAPNSEVQVPGGRRSARLMLKALVLPAHTSVWMCRGAQEDGFLMRVSLSLIETSESDLFWCPLKIHLPQTSQYHSKSGIFSRTQVIHRYGSSSGRFGKTSSSDQLLSTCFLTVLFTSL